jgi:hypothetical protein
MNAGSSDYIGLFGYVGSGGQIHNVGIEIVNVTGHSYVGGLCSYNSGTVINCYSTGTVSVSDFHGGGLCGWNDGVVSKCYSSVAVIGGSYQDFGGLCGCNYGTISNSYASGAVNGNNSAMHVGGFCGLNYGTISNSYGIGTVEGSNSSQVGGLCGDNCGTVTNCYASGSVSGRDAIGGLCGVCGSDYEQGTIIDCYAIGFVMGTSRVGGLCGDDWGNTIANCFWDKNTSGQSTSAGGTGKTTMEMKTLSTFTAAGWDFVDVWGIGNSQTYPYLKPVTDFNPADMNYSGTVDFQDFAILAANWLSE